MMENKKQECGIHTFKKTTAQIIEELTAEKAELQRKLEEAQKALRDSADIVAKYSDELAKADPLTSRLSKAEQERDEALKQLHGEAYAIADLESKLRKAEAVVEAAKKFVNTPYQGIGMPELMNLENELAAYEGKEGRAKKWMLFWVSTS